MIETTILCTQFWSNPFFCLAARISSGWYSKCMLSQIPHLPPQMKPSSSKMSMTVWGGIHRLDSGVSILLGTTSFVQLQKEHRVKRENVYAVGIQCDGMCDAEALREAGCDGLTGLEDGEMLTVHTLYGDKTVEKQAALLGKCRTCKSKRIADYDELLGEQGADIPSSRFDQVAALEAMTPEERFAFWRKELSKCIRCNACRNVCPACSCEKCVFDNPTSGVKNKAVADWCE